MANAGELKVPYVADLETPGAIWQADLPWHGNFTRLQKLTPAKFDTRFKIAHNNQYLCLGIEVYDDMRQVTANKYPFDHPGRWRNDNLTIDIDPDGRNMLGGKIMIDANGDFTDYWGVDDNTGTGRLIFDPLWNSQTTVRAVKKYADRWTVEVCIPLGAFFNGNKDLSQLRFNIGRERVKSKEALSFAPIKTANFAASRYFNKLVLENFDADPFKWMIASVSASGKRVDGENTARVSAKLWNQSKTWRIAQCKVTLTDPNGKEHIKRVGVVAERGRSFNIDLAFADVPRGRCKFAVELFDTGYNFIAGNYFLNELDFQPVRIKVLEPSYRNNIYHTQKLDRIRAAVTLEEGMGQPLEVTLTGPDNFSKKVVIPAAKAVNNVEFEFKNMPVGDYFIRAAGVSTRIRKLPKAPQEVRIGKNNITCVNGKMFLPIGYYSIDPEWKEPGLNRMSYFRDEWRSKEELKRFLDRLAAAGMRGVLYPYMEPSGKKQIFVSKERQRDKLTAQQKKLIAEAVSVCRDHPGFLAYFAADEPEGHGHSEEWYEDFYKYISELDPYHPVLICNYGVNGMRRFYRGCDIIESDAYPDYFVDNTHSQPLSVCYDFVKFAGARRAPWLALQTFDWGLKNAAGSYGRAPTYDEVREQMGLALLADAKGFNMYIATLKGALSNQLRVTQQHIGKEVQALKAVLLQDTQSVKYSPMLKGIYVGKKVWGTETAILIVNSTDQPRKISVDTGKLAGKLAVSGENRWVEIRNGRFTDTVEPHRFNIYLAGGLPAHSVDHPAVRAEIIQRDLDRRRPGNLAAAGELNYNEIIDYHQGKIPADVPVIRVSSQLATHNVKNGATQYFLQDGIRETKPMEIMTWTPLASDKKPWIEIDFKRSAVLEKALFYLHKSPAGAQLKSGRIMAQINGQWVEAGSFAGNDQFIFEVKLKPLKTGRVRIELTDLSLRGRLLEEIEIYGK